MNVFKSKQTFSIVLSICLFLGVKAQSDFRPGYIITLQGDTVKGLINYRGDIGNAKDCIFKKEVDQEKIIYAPDQIKSYRFIDGKYYISTNYLNYKFKNQVFVEYIIKGSISIYYYRDDITDHYYTSKDTLVIELDHHEIEATIPENGNLVQRKSQKYKGQLKYLMSDQPALFNKVDGIVCNTKDLISLTREYQKLSCPSQECLTYEKKTGKDIETKFGMFFSAGLSHLSSPPYNITLSDFDVTKALNFKTSFTYEIGATLNFYLNLIDENKFCIQLSPALNFVNYESYMERTLYPLLYSYKINIDFTALKVPLLFKYSFYSSNWSFIPYAKLGVGCAIYLNQKGTYYYSSVPLPGVAIQRSDYLESLTTSYDTKPKKFYFLIGTGTDIKLGKKLLFVGATYEYGEGQLKGFRSDAQLQIGFQF